MNDQLALYHVENGIATITLNRPERLNAMTREVTLKLIEYLDRVDEDDSVRAVIVTGAGKAFCSGADISTGATGMNKAAAEEAGTVLDYSNPRIRDGGGMLTLRMFRCLKPIVGAVNGPAVGIGATMLLAMDARLASVDARIGFPFARRGIVPEAASSWFLPRIVGIARALEWTFSGRMLSAQEALEGGLFRSLHSTDTLLSAANAFARELTSHSAPVSVALTRQMMWRMLGASHPMEAHRIDSRGVYSRTRSADAREGVASFFEKREPQFKDRISDQMPNFFPWWEDKEYE